MAWGHGPFHNFPHHAHTLKLLARAKQQEMRSQAANVRHRAALKLRGEQAPKEPGLFRRILRTIRGGGD